MQQYEIKDFAFNRQDEVIAISKRIAFNGSKKETFNKSDFADLQRNDTNLVYKKIVVDKSDKIIGYLFAEKREGSLYLFGLGVDKKYQSQGIGSMLVDDLLESINPKDYENVDLFVHEDNIDAKNLYKKKGFKPASSEYVLMRLKK